MPSSRCWLGTWKVMSWSEDITSSDNNDNQTKSFRSWKLWLSSYTHQHAGQVAAGPFLFYFLQV